MLCISGRKNTEFLRYFYYFCKLDKQKHKRYQKSIENILENIGGPRGSHHGIGPAAADADGPDICNQQSHGDSLRKHRRKGDF